MPNEMNIEIDMKIRTSIKENSGGKNTIKSPRNKRKKRFLPIYKHKTYRPVIKHIHKPTPKF